MSEAIQQLDLKSLTEQQIAEMAEFTKSNNVDNQPKNEEVISEPKVEAPIIESEIDEPVDDQPAASIDKEAIKAAILSGNKIMEANYFMKLKNARNNLIAQKDMINQKVNFMFSGSLEQMDIIQSRVSEVTEEALKKASMEEMEEFLTFDGVVVGLNFAEVMTDKDKIEGTREFLEYLKICDKTEKEIDANIAEIDDICSVFSSELLENAKDNYSWDQYIYNVFKGHLTEDIPEEERSRIEKVLDVKNSALTLEPLKEMVQNDLNMGRRSSMLNAYKNRMIDTMKTAEKYTESKGFHIYFALFDDIDSVIGRTDTTNLFAYIFARYIKFHSDKFTKIDHVFIAQVTQNLIMLKRGEMQDPNRATFVHSIEEIYEMILTVKS